jgi:hypothetical protein
MWFVHEVHEVVGAREDAFEAAFREGYAPALAGTDARLLHYLHHAHGSGASYRVVTWTAVRDAAAFADLAERLRRGDLAAWASGLDGLRTQSEAKLLEPLPWSPLQDVDLGAVATDGVDHEPTLWMEDTVWPHVGKLDAYVERSGAHYFESMKRDATLLEIQAGFRTAFGSGRSREIVLWQKVVNPKGLVPLLTREVPARYKAPGAWMHDALAVRDRWESRLLRSARWSPGG